MHRLLAISCLLLPVSLASAESRAPHAKTRATPAVASDQPHDGCGLLSLTGTALSDETARLRAETVKRWTGPKGMAPAIEQVWEWCAKPDLVVRVWSACDGAGDSKACALYAAPISKGGALGKTTVTLVGWAPPVVERIDSGDAPTGWKGSGLKVTMTAGRGTAVFGMYAVGSTLKTTKKEWDE